MKTKILSVIDYILLLTMIALTIIGILFIYSSSFNSNGEMTTLKYKRQIVFALVGLVLMILFAWYDYRKLERYIFWIAIFMLAALIVLAMPTIVSHISKQKAKDWFEANGASSWLKIGIFGIQPSEFSKIVFIFFLGWYFNITDNETPLKRFIVSLIILLIPVGIILMQPDLGTASVFIPVYLIMCFAAGIPLRYIMMVLFGGAFSVIFAMLPYWEEIIVQHPVAFVQIFTNSNLRLIVTSGLIALTMICLLGRYFYSNNKSFFWLSYVFGILTFGMLFSIVIGKTFKPYQVNRLIVFLNPYVDTKNSGWQIINSMTAIGSGGLWGKGFMKGTQSLFDFVPEKSTDFIFSIISEEWGFLGCTFIFLIYLVFMIRIIHIIKDVHNHYGYYCACGIFAMFFFHFLVNVGMTIGLMPITGIPLIFLSYGGSSLLTGMISVGLLMSIHYRKYDFMEESSARIIG